MHLGSAAENPVLLSPCEWQDVFLDQAAQVRRGERKNGVWNVMVERDGEYEIALRRWAVEADAPLTAGVPAYEGADGTYPAGVALPIAAARLRIGSIDRSQRAQPGANEISFDVALGRGRAQLQTWFLDPDGEELCGAYYVYVRRK